MTSWISRFYGYFLTPLRQLLPELNDTTIHEIDHLLRTSRNSIDGLLLVIASSAGHTSALVKNDNGYSIVTFQNRATSWFLFVVSVVFGAICFVSVFYSRNLSDEYFISIDRNLAWILLTIIGVALFVAPSAISIFYGYLLHRLNLGRITRYIRRR